MTPAADAVARMSLVLLAGLGGSWALRNRSAALGHWVVAATLACAAMTPLLGAALPAWGPAIGSPPGPVAVRETFTFAVAGADGTAAARADGARVPPMAPTEAWWAAGWLGGTLFALASLAAGLARLRRLAARARRPEGRWLDEAAALARLYGLSRPVTLLQTDHPSLLVTWGAWRPCILLPASAPRWPAERMRVVLAHELAHVARGDWTAQMGAELLRAAVWFNPLAWIACRRLRNLGEYAADDLVLGLGVRGCDYAAHLLDLARSFRQHGHARVPAPAIARPSTLRKRIAAMLTTTRDRRPPTHATRAVAAATLLAVSMLVAGAGAQGAATVSGTVVDQSGAYVPGVTLTLTNQATDATREVRSDAAGHYEFAGLPAGDYRLQTARVGFGPTDQVVALSAGQALEHPVTMALGHLVETVRVNARTAASRPRVSTATPPAAAPCEATGAGGQIKPPRKIKDVRPALAPDSAAAGLEGIVVLDARIDTRGNVADLDVTRSAHPDLDEAARDAVRQWQFTPTLLNCVPVDVFMTVTVTFEP
ncbi:MAG: TonB family protein [Vicinamibacterales bacterium]